MTIFYPDYTEVKTKAYEKLPEGKYCVYINKYEVKTNLATNEQYFTWYLKIFSNEHYNGRYVFYQTPLGGQYSWKLSALLTAASPSYNMGGFDPEDFIGKPVEIEVGYPISKKDNLPTKYETVMKIATHVELGSTGSIEFDIP